MLSINIPGLFFFFCINTPTVISRHFYSAFIFQNTYNYIKTLLWNISSSPINLRETKGNFFCYHLHHWIWWWWPCDSSQLWLHSSGSQEDVQGRPWTVPQAQTWSHRGYRQYSSSSRAKSTREIKICSEVSIIAHLSLESHFSSCSIKEPTQIQKDSNHFIYKIEHLSLNSHAWMGLPICGALYSTFQTILNYWS